MVDLEKDVSLELRMKNDWDARLAHDYRYWMSDGVSSDDEMWDTGRRDFQILVEELPISLLNSSIVLEIGCGVGRIVNAAAEYTHEVIGIDVSENAIELANKLCKKQNTTFLLGNGVDLMPLQDSSIDIGISFAALGSTSAKVTAMYLKELSRVVKKGGCIRLQLYFGQEQDIAQEDTLALRSYNADRFIQALGKSGFTTNYLKEVTLPFEVSDYERGVVAYIIGGFRNEENSCSVDEILSSLRIIPEKVVSKHFKGSEAAHLVALARARQHLENGDLENAKKAVYIAEKEFSDESEPAKIIKKVITDIESNNAYSTQNISQNLEIIQTSEGPAYSYKGINLSHLSCPQKAGMAWARRTLDSVSFNTDSIIVLGFGDGHFIKSLRSVFQGEILICETDKEILALNNNFNLDNIRMITSVNELEIELLRGAPIFSLPSLPFYNPELAEKAKILSSARKYSTTLSPRLGIVGPFLGGTLPIAGYIQQALFSLDKEAHLIDLSSYSGMFKSFSTLLTKKHRQSELENSMVELVSQLVLNIVEEKNLDIVISVAQAPLSPKVLETLRERGVITVHWFMEDTRRFQSWKEIAKYYDYFYLIQKNESIEEVLSAGGNRVKYLPLACDPEFHRPIRLTADEKVEFGSTVSFVGAGYNNRLHVFSKLSDLDFKIWGTEWPNVTPFDRLVQRKGARIAVSEYIKIFQASTINLNLHSSQERDGVDPSGDFINPRVFELASCGAFQLTDARSLLPELFKIGEEVVTFSEEREIRELIKYYSQNQEERLSIVEAAKKRVLAEHTYAHRLTEILNQIYSDFGDHLSKRMDASPWQRTLKQSEKFPELHSLLMDTKNKKLEPTLDNLVRPFLDQSTILNEVEQKLMFMHHMRGQITQIQRLRQE